MKLTYRIEKKDHLAFQWHHFWRSSTVWRQYGFVMLLGTLLISATLYLDGREFQSAVIFLAGYLLLMVLIFAVSGYIQITSAVRRMASGDNNGVVGDCCFIVDDAAVCEQTGPVEIKVKWIGIHKVSATEDYAFIFYNPYTAFIVPKRAFVEESDFSRFVQDCVARLPEQTLNPRF